MRQRNETVSMGDAAVSLRKLPVGILGYSKLKVPSPGQIFILGGGGILGYSKLKDRSPGQIFILGGGAYSWLLKTQSPNFWPNFHWGGGYSWPAQNWYYWQNEPKILEAELALALQIVCVRDYLNNLFQSIPHFELNTRQHPNYLHGVYFNMINPVQWTLDLKRQQNACHF